MFIFFILVFMTSCMTHDSELQTARMVEPGENTFTFGYHYLAEHDDDVWNKRKENDFSQDYNAANVATGANILIRRGLTEYMDMGLNFSLGSSALEMRFALFNGERYASAFGAKWVVPALAIEVPNLYRYKFVWYNSYELLPNFAVYAAPHIEFKPNGNLKKQYRGISSGFFVGKDSGVVVEATYAQAVDCDDPVTYEQLIIGYTTGLDKLRGRLQADRWSQFIKLYPSIGSSVFPTPSIGLQARYLSDSMFNYEVSVDLGIGPIPKMRETKVGLMTTRMYAVRALYEFTNVHHAKFGFARREMRGNFDLDMEGWHHLYAYNHGIQLEWEQALSKEWNISWVGIYAPLLFLPHQHSFKERGDYVSMSDEFESIADKWEHRVSFSLLNVHKEF